LADVDLNYNFGGAQLTSISSYTDRNILVIRDTTSLTASVTGGNIGLPESIYTIDSPLDDATKANIFTQEVRLSGAKNHLEWVLGGFYSHMKRNYGQDLFTEGFSAASGIPSAGTVAGTDNLFHSSIHYKLDQFALFGEGTLAVTDKLNVTGGLRYYHFSEDKDLVFDGFFTSYTTQNGNTSADGVAPRVILSYKLTDTTNLNAQVSKGFRLGGINDPLNTPICTPEDLATFGGSGNWKDESTWDYEVGTKSRIFNNRGAFNLTAFYMDIHDLQTTVTAGSCSSRLIYNVPKARSQGLEGEFSVAPTRHFDFGFSGSYHDAEFKSSVLPVAATGIVDGRRLPTVPKFEMSANATARWDMMSNAVGYLTGSVSYVGGDRYTQAGDLELGLQPNSPCGPTAQGCLNMESFGSNTIGGPLTQQYLTYNPILPSYTLVNARIGVLKGKWDVALYANNLTDERALLSFDRERGTYARIFYLTNQPRTFGITARVGF
jgi:iron complex outermembrane recepter protein